MRKDRLINTFKVLKFIEENPNTYLREISRSLNLNPATVHRILRDVQDFLEFISLNKSVDYPLPNMPVIIRLKEGYTPEGILRYLQVKYRLKR